MFANKSEVVFGVNLGKTQVLLDMRQITADSKKDSTCFTRSSVQDVLVTNQ